MVWSPTEWVFPTWVRMHALDTGEAVNFLKGTIVKADQIVTVNKLLLQHLCIQHENFKSRPEVGASGMSL